MFWKTWFSLRTEEDSNIEWGMEKDDFVLHLSKLYLNFESVNLGWSVEIQS